MIVAACFCPYLQEILPRRINHCHRFVIEYPYVPHG